MKKMPIFIFSLLLCSQISFACSMYKITHNGKTIVGNNEDWFSPNAQAWFIPAKDGTYGVMHVGFINGFPQGGINEEGLMFDGFAMPALAVNNVNGKINIPLDQAITQAMQTCRQVEEVKEYFLTIDLSEMVTGMLVFVDKTGDYLIIEGDELILGEEKEQVFSNFYPSQTRSEEVSIPFYQRGLAFINHSEGESSFSYCSSVMGSLQQNITQYTTIYDLDALTIRLHHFQNFKDYQEIDLRKELEKGAHQLYMHELFPENTAGLKNYRMYNDAENPTRFLEAMMKDYGSGLSGPAFERVKENLAGPINAIGYEWLNDKKDTKGAIAIFQYATKLLPSNANLFDSLGEAFFRNKNYTSAIKNYKKSLQLDPRNKNALSMLQKIEEEQESSD